MALSGITTDAQKAAVRFVADVVEDKTGTRPDTSTLKPDVKLEGTDVKLTLNGLTKEQLGSLDIGAVVSETTSRLGAYVALALTVPAYASETSDLLSLQATLLDAYLTGLGGAGTPVELGATRSWPRHRTHRRRETRRGQGAPPWQSADGRLLIASACVGQGRRHHRGRRRRGAGRRLARLQLQPEPPARRPPARRPQRPPRARPAAGPVARLHPSRSRSGADAEPAARATASESTPAEPSSGGSTGRTIGWVSLAVGGAGLGVGAVLGVLAATKHRDLVQECGGTECPPQAYGSVDEYHTLGTASTVSLIGGAGAAALGLVLVVASPSSYRRAWSAPSARSFPGSASEPWAPRGGSE